MSTQYPSYEQEPQDISSEDYALGSRNFSSGASRPVYTDYFNNVTKNPGGPVPSDPSRYVPASSFVASGGVPGYGSGGGGGGGGGGAGALVTSGITSGLVGFAAKMLVKYGKDYVKNLFNAPDNQINMLAGMVEQTEIPGMSDAAYQALNDGYGLGIDLDFSFDNNITGFNWVDDKGGLTGQLVFNGGPADTPLIGADTLWSTNGANIVDSATGAVVGQIDLTEELIGAGTNYINMPVYGADGSVTYQIQDLATGQVIDPALAEASGITSANTLDGAELGAATAGGTGGGFFSEWGSNLTDFSWMRAGSSLAAGLPYFLDGDVGSGVAVSALTYAVSAIPGVGPLLAAGLNFLDWFGIFEDNDWVYYQSNFGVGNDGLLTRTRYGELDVDGWPDGFKKGIGEVDDYITSTFNSYMNEMGLTLGDVDNNQWANSGGQTLGTIGYTQQDRPGWYLEGGFWASRVGAPLGNAQQQKDRLTAFGPEGVEDAATHALENIFYNAKFNEFTPKQNWIFSLKFGETGNPYLAHAAAVGAVDFTTPKGNSYTYTPGNDPYMDLNPNFNVIHNPL